MRIEGSDLTGSLGGFFEEVVMKLGCAVEEESEEESRGGRRRSWV